MKKIKSMVLVLVLTLGFAGNIFAADVLNIGITNIFTTIITTIVTSFSGDDEQQCPVRTCSGCKPSDRNCRPPMN